MSVPWSSNCELRGFVYVAVNVMKLYPLLSLNSIIVKAWVDTGKSTMTQVPTPYPVALMIYD